MKRKIYIATSWSNSGTARIIASELRNSGHDVFLFCEPDGRPEGFDRFVFNGNDWKGKDLKKMEYIEFLGRQLQQSFAL